MGLDQYAYIENKPEDIKFAYWRKHNRLQGWMDALWHAKGNVTTEEDKPWGSSFNGQILYLTRDDINQLELDIIGHTLPKTQGFFFGEDSYGYYSDDQAVYYHYKNDIDFIKKAKEYLAEGKTIYYRCSW